MSIVPAEEASRRLRADHDLLLAEVNELTGEQLAATYHLASGPLGDFCESLHDLVAHVLMWDEINLAVLTEAAAGRAHWSLDPQWETLEAGQLLNRGGVDAGRQLPASLLLHRRRAVRDAVLGELGRCEGRAWTGAGKMPALAQGITGTESVDRALPASVLARRHPPEPSCRPHPGGPGGKAPPVMRTRIITEPRFEAETTALLARLGTASPISGYGAVLAARAEPADPALAGHPDPEVLVADLYLPARHGPVGVRWYRHHAAASPGPLLLWLHGGGSSAAPRLISTTCVLGSPIRRV